MKFADLKTGDRFVFLDDEHREARIMPEIRVAYRIKTDDREYETLMADGSVGSGRVGAGDNPVRKLPNAQ